MKNYSKSYINFHFFNVLHFCYVLTIVIIDDISKVELYDKRFTWCSINVFTIYELHLRLLSIDVFYLRILNS